MSKNGKVEPDKIHILDFIIQDASLSSTFGFGSEQVENHSLELAYDIGFNVKDKLAKAEIKVEVGALTKDETKIGHCKFELSFIFQIENLNELVSEEGDTLLVNGGLNNALASITYSTSRGILMTRFQGTLLKDFILPIISPQSLLKDE